jgi:hypothetical protein
LINYTLLIFYGLLLGVLVAAGISIFEHNEKEMYKKDLERSTEREYSLLTLIDFDIIRVYNCDEEGHGWEFHKDYFYLNSLRYYSICNFKLIKNNTEIYSE